MRANWRYALAREVTYIETGRYLCTLPYQMLLSAAALRLLWPALPLWLVLVLALPAVGAFNVIGRAYRRWGWQQEAASVPTLENMAWVQWVYLIWFRRLLEAHHMPLDGIPDPARIEPWFHDLLSRGRH